MFSTKLRQRREWKAVPGDLLALVHPKWQEGDIEMHDLQIPIPKLSQQNQNSFFRLLLLSATDLEPIDPTMNRIERLLHQGGQHVGIVFLLNEIVPSSNGLTALVNLQMSLQGSLSMPILPLHSTSSLVSTVIGFQRQLVAARTPPVALHPYSTLLPFCSNKPPIPQCALNVLSDICSSLSELSEFSSTADGQQKIRDMLPETSPGEMVNETAENIIEFWKEEVIRG